MSALITSLVGEELEGGFNKWCGSLAAPNGSVYGTPNHARRVAKFNPVDKSITEIGPDFVGRWKWRRGTMTDNGIIYCPPCGEEYDLGILKIDTNTDNVTELNVNLLPEQGDHMWESCAAAVDGCIYFMPSKGRRIMKLDPTNNDAMSSVGDDLGYGYGKYIGTVVGIDGCVYGMPYNSSQSVKYDPINGITSFVGEEADPYFGCSRNGALGRNGCIYALTKDGRVLKIDTVNNSHGFVGNSVDWDQPNRRGWGDAFLGIDGCIYWPPYDATHTLKYDPHTNLTSLVGDDFGTQRLKWICGTLASDRVVYCIPSHANQVLAIDPIGEFLATTKAVMLDHPEEFGSLFQTIEADEDESVLSMTNFDHAVVKFGQNIVFEVLEKAMKPVNDYCEESNLWPFMITASCKESPVCVINHLLRCDLSWLNSCTISSLEGSVSKKNKKRRIK